ncbi:MAG: VTT domain-containing protein [Candidatus Woesearchaeota archaeon]|jgi:membrane protein YqaA with SNARE-associated domain|nr:VTT domain-containing protein [Candidatus Woesearchaeota archaeon]MDP7323456.1 VTT domain-containing protein [Candidatus Woesearchaeota archaeon]MDP7457262.1 VTT domain-containing protein [Candidatus Woesearchaeota archaeon]|tara:strand:- start:423 stop:1058 length:636 start_codon:yes stop_codon:yes gene_type:complete
MALFKKGTEKKGVSAKVVLFIIFILFLYLLYYNKSYFIPILQEHPAVWSFYQHINYQIDDRSLPGLFYANAFGSLFFIMLPIELIFIYYSLLGYNTLLLILISTVGSLVGMAFDYFFGYVFGKGVLRTLMRKSYDKLEALNNNFGAAIIIFGNAIIIFPSQLYALIVGSTRYSFKKFMVYTTIGRIIKYSILILGKDYFLEVVIPWMNSIF